MTERIGRVSRSAQTSQQTDFQCAFLMPSHQYFQKALHFPPLRKIADLDPVRLNLVSIISEPLRIRFLMNPVDGRNRSFSGLPGNQFVRQEHELLDQLMRNIVLFAHQADCLSFRIQDHAHFRHVQFQGALLEPPLPQDRREAPGAMDITFKPGRRLSLQNAKCFAIG